MPKLFSNSFSDLLMTLLSSSQIL